MATTTTPPPRTGGAQPIRTIPRTGPPIVRFYRTAVGKKWVMAITGLMLMSFVIFHLIGNLKLYLSKEEINLYGEALRDMPGALLPRTVLLWTSCHWICAWNASVSVRVSSRRASGK